MKTRTNERLLVRKAFMYLMIALYLGAGIDHFLHPEPFEKIVPRFIPFPAAMVYISGAFEILFALMLIPLFTRRLAAWGIILLLIAVFPANIKMMLDYMHQHNPHTWITILRLPLQGLLIWWASVYAKRERIGDA